MLQYGFLLCLSLFHRSVVCTNVSEAALLSQDSLSVEESIVNANIWGNFTESRQFVRDEDESKFSANDTIVPSDKEDEGDQFWDVNQFLEVWNPIVISRIWKNETYRDAGVSLSCGQDLTRYMTAVSRKTNWALKSKSF